jgi:hypothetical protein
VLVLRWIVPPAALIALVGWLASGNGSDPLPAQRQKVALPSMPTSPDRRAAVEKFVAQKNAEERKESDAFVRAGWHIDNVPPPDAQLLALDPSLLSTREPELRQQIATTTPSAGQAANLARIAREARDEQTQVAAVDALGRIHGDEAQDELIDLLHALPEGTLARREVAPLLRPRDLSDPRAARLALLLDDGALNPVERKQIAFTLSLVGLRDRSALPEAALEQLSPSARALLDETASLARFERRTP